MFLKPLFTQEEAVLLLAWLDMVDPAPPAAVMDKLKNLIGLWAS